MGGDDFAGLAIRHLLTIAIDQEHFVSGIGATH